MWLCPNAGLNEDPFADNPPCGKECVKGPGLYDCDECSEYSIKENPVGFDLAEYRVFVELGQNLDYAKQTHDARSRAHNYGTYGDRSFHNAKAIFELLTGKEQAKLRKKYPHSYRYLSIADHYLSILNKQNKKVPGEIEAYSLANKDKFSDFHKRMTEERIAGHPNPPQDPGEITHRQYRDNKAQGIHQVKSLSYVEENRKYSLALGNLKLSGTLIIFNLPTAETCPGAGVCKNFCYAKKSELRPAVKAARRRNWDYSKRKSFVKDMKNMILKIQDKFPGVRGIRTHESGDFYSRAYAGKWAEIQDWASLLEKPMFMFFYTKSAFVKEVLWGPGAHIWFSLGGIQDKQYPLYGNRAYVLPKDITPGKALEKGVFSCEGGHPIPKVKDQWYVCGRDCDFCMAMKSGNDLAVGFPMH